MTVGGSRGPIVQRAGAKSDQPGASQSLLLGHSARVTISNFTVRAADRSDMALGSGGVP